MKLVEKAIAHIKGDVLGSVLTENEYYYLMFRCENEEDIELIKSMTPEECKLYLDCCWYFDVNNTAQLELGFLKAYRKSYHPKNEGES